MPRRNREEIVSAEEFCRYFYANVERARTMAWRLLGGDTAGADTLVQDAFVRAFRSLSSFQGHSTLDLWFCRILVRATQNHQRGSWMRPGARAATLPARDEAAAVDDGRQEIRKEIAALPRSEREVFVLAHLEGFHVTDVAHLVGRGQGTVETQLRHATARLRSIWRAPSEEGATDGQTGNRATGPEG
jgi:RNA polymerase sigma-70 factor (ECF subfamily)